MFESRNPWADWPLKKTPQPLATQPTNNPQPTSWLFNESGTNPPSVKKSFCHYMPCLNLKHEINILTSFPWIQLNTSCSYIFVSITTGSVHLLTKSINQLSMWSFLFLIYLWHLSPKWNGIICLVHLPPIKRYQIAHQPFADKTSRVTLGLLKH